MRGKRYDLSQVSQATKDAYCQASIDFDCSRSVRHVVLRTAKAALYQEAEVKPPKPKTAREILEEYLRDDGQTGREGWDEVRKAVLAIHEALKVMP